MRYWKFSQETKLKQKLFANSEKEVGNFFFKTGTIVYQKKLLAPVSNNRCMKGAILVSVIKPPRKKNFLRGISDFTEFSSENFKSSCLRTIKRFLTLFHMGSFG